MNAINKQVGHALETSGEAIGAITFWSLRGANARRDELRASLEELGLSMPKDPKPQVRIRYALESARRRNDTTIVFDKVSDTKSEIVYALSERGVNEVEKKAAYEHRTRISLDKISGALLLEDELDPVLCAVRDRYNELAIFASVYELGLYLTVALQGRTRDVGLGGVNLRGGTGGVYFVPRANMERLRCLAEIMDRAAHFGAMTVWPVPAGDRAHAQAHQAVRMDLAEQLRETKLSVTALLEELNEEPAGGWDPEGKRFVARAAAFQQIRARAELYADLLGDVREDLLGQVAELQTAIETRIQAKISMSDFD
jgi:hypothetical protein